MNDQQNIAFLAGGGEMGALMRTHDWSTSPAGPPGDWPPALRSAVGLMLANKHIMFVAWGPDLAFLYNDAYRPVFGQKHPWALGRPFREVWSEVWDEVEPLVNSALGGEATWSENLHLVLHRNGFPEDCWFTFSYSPIRDEDGVVVGLFCAATETTDSVLAKQRLIEQAHRQRRLFEKAPGFIAILTGPDHVFEFVNDAYVQLAGGRDLVGRTVREAFPDIADQGFFELLDGVYATGERFVAEGVDVTLREAPDQPGREVILDFVYEPMRDETGDVTGIFVEGHEITEIRRAEATLRESEERFARFAASSTDVLWIRRADTLEMEYLSHAFATVYGLSPQEAMGDVRRWAKLIVPEDRDVALEHLETARRGEAKVHEFRIRRPSDGAFRWIRDHSFPLLDEAGVKWVGGIGTDVTEAKLLTEHQTILLAELQHRVRNVMAMLQSVVHRTAKTASSVADYEVLTTGRLMALARTQTLLTRAVNKGVQVDALLGEELKAQADHEGQYELSGPDVAVSPKAAELLSLAFHELATNALKYGALSVSQGRVEVKWKVSRSNGKPHLRLDWTEHRPALPDWSPPTRRGFGSELIEHRVPYELRGRGKLEIRPEGMHAWIEFPLGPGSSILETDAPVSSIVSGGSIDMTLGPDLVGQTVLVLEDDFYLAQDVVSALRGARAEIVGPFPTAADAIAAVDGASVTAAVLDINLGSGPSFETMHVLRRAGTPFVFLTGYDQDVIPAEFADVVRLQKPAAPREVVRAIAALTEGAS